MEFRTETQRVIAEGLARLLHRGQTDKVGRPYIEHVERVVAAVDGSGNKVVLEWYEDRKAAVAYLHDVVEDTPCTLDDLAAFGFDPLVIKGVDSITRRDGESYEDYIQRVGDNFLATVVKRADLLDHLRDIDEVAPSLRGRYEEALAYLYSK